MWPHKRLFSERCTAEEALMNHCQRQMQQTPNSDEWNLGTPPSRVTFSRPAQRKTSNGVKRIFGVNNDSWKTESNRSNENFIQSPNGITGVENDSFNWAPKISNHCDSFNLFKEHCRQWSPMKELTMNYKKPVFQNVFQDVPKCSSDGFDCSHVIVREQKPPDPPHYNTNGYYQSPVSLDDSPRTLSDFSKDSVFSEFSSNSCSSKYLHEFFGSSTHDSKEPCRISQDYLNTSKPPVDKIQSCNAFDWHLVKQIKADPENQPFPESPESGGRMSSTESVYKQTLALKEEFGDLSDDALHSPMQVPSPASFNLFSDTVHSPSIRPTSQLNGQGRKIVQLQPYLTDPDEELARIRTNPVPENLPHYGNFLPLKHEQAW